MNSTALKSRLDCVIAQAIQSQRLIGAVVMVALHGEVV